MQYTDYFGLLSDYRTVTEFGGKSVINSLLAGLVVTLILLLATNNIYVPNNNTKEIRNTITDKNITILSILSYLLYSLFYHDF